MPDHPLKPPKLPTLPPLRPPLPKKVPAALPTPTTRGSGSSEVPPPIVLSDSPTPPWGVPKITAFESRTKGAWRNQAPSLDQWMVACSCVIAAAAVGFAVGRSSAPAAHPTMNASPEHAACPDPTNPAAAAQSASVRNIAQAAEGRVETPSTSAEGVALAPSPSSAPDPAAQQANEKAIARAMSRGSRRAASCRGSSSPVGTAHVSVTFLPTGEVKAATVRGAPFAGTAEGECIVGKFRPLRVPPFTGNDVTVHRDLTLE